MKPTDSMPQAKHYRSGRYLYLASFKVRTILHQIRLQLCYVFTGFHKTLTDNRSRR